MPPCLGQVLFVEQLADGSSLVGPQDDLAQKRRYREDGMFGRRFSAGMSTEFVVTISLQVRLGQPLDRRRHQQGMGEGEIDVLGAMLP